MTLFRLAPLLILPLLGCHADAAPPAKPPSQMQAPAPNCALPAPPPQAGVDRAMGAVLRIYPRNPDIGPDYAGCQTLWLEDGDGWAVLTVAHYAAGHVAWIDSPQQERDPMAECRVDAGKVTRGDPDLCAQLDDMRFDSAPAACLPEAGDKGPACERH